MADENHSIILYDGVCNLCDHAVQFILPRDPKGRFRFTPFQGERATALLARHGMPNENPPSSLVLIEQDQIYLESSAALRIARGLRFPWNMLAVFLVIPRPIRDAAYRWIARNRYRWFGREEACLLPRPEWRDRFLETSGV